MDKNERNGLKGFFPFRLGTTSYIIPSDIVTNVSWLSDVVDDIELVLFESEKVSNLPDERTVETLRSIAAEKNLTYTVHFPLDIAFCSLEEPVRRESAAMCGRIIRLMEPLRPFAYIVHCTGGDENGPLGIRMLKKWRAAARESFRRLTGCGVAAERFAVETLGYPFRYIESVVEEFNMSVCLDIGHILLNRYSIEEYLSRYFDRTRVVHLHGIIAGKDHKSLSGFDPPLLEKIMGLLAKGSRIPRALTLEIFSEKDLRESLEILERHGEAGRKAPGPRAHGDPALVSPFPFPHRQRRMRRRPTGRK